jgi:putative flippase GtrA
MPHSRSASSHHRKPGGIFARQIGKILRFGIVGGLGTVLNTLLVLTFLSLADRIHDINPGGHMAATLAAIAAWAICCGVNYLLNAAWTFHRWPPTWKQAGQYYLAALSAFFIQIVLLNLLLFLIQPDRSVETAVLNGVAVATGSLFNYVFASFWVFGEKTAKISQ